MGAPSAVLALPSAGARYETLHSFATRWRMTGTARMATLPVPVWRCPTDLVRQALSAYARVCRSLRTGAPEALARQARAVKPASIRYSFLRPQHIRPSGIADRCAACLAAASLETPRASWAIGCNVRSAQQRTRGLKSRPVSITRLQRRTNRSSSGSVPSLMLPGTSQPQVRLLRCGLYPRES